MPPLNRDIEPNDSLKMMAAKWVFQQSVPTVLLFSILATVWFGGSYVLKTVIPDQLKAIAAGYERLESNHREERELRDRFYGEQREKDRDMIRDLLDLKRSTLGAKP